MHFKLLFACIILFFTISVLAQDRVDCDPNNRPEVCTFIYLPVCGWTYSGGSFTYGNECAACSDPNVEYHTQGECTDEGSANQEWSQEEECTWEEEFGFEGTDDDYFPDLATYCPYVRPDVCTDEYNPVCVVKCTDGDCRRTMSNWCTACQDYDLQAYVPGPCEAERIKCSVPDPAIDVLCTLEYDPVCGYPAECTSQESCGTTSGNACQACNSGGADYYIKGECGSWANL